MGPRREDRAVRANGNGPRSLKNHSGGHERRDFLLEIGPKGDPGGCPRLPEATGGREPLNALGAPSLGHVDVAGRIHSDPGDVGELARAGPRASPTRQEDPLS